MTERSVTHATFVLERTYAASPARVFAAFADPAAKKRWFASPDEMGPAQHEIDFRVGGREINRAGPPGGPVYTFDARYQDIVPNQRIVTTYEMLMADTRISVSLATVELTPAPVGRVWCTPSRARSWTATTPQPSASTAPASCWRRWAPRSSASPCPEPAKP